MRVEHVFDAHGVLVDQMELRGVGGSIFALQS